MQRRWRRQRQRLICILIFRSSTIIISMHKFIKFLIAKSIWFNSLSMHKCELSNLRAFHRLNFNFIDFLSLFCISLGAHQSASDANKLIISIVRVHFLMSERKKISSSSYLLHFYRSIHFMLCESFSRLAFNSLVQKAMLWGKYSPWHSSLSSLLITFWIVLLGSKMMIAGTRDGSLVIKIKIFQK